MNQALHNWREEFSETPGEALDRLVLGLVPLGALSQLSLGELLDLAFEAGDEALDAALKCWFERQILEPIPEGVTAERWGAVLDDLFRGIATLRLQQTGALLRDSYDRIRLWLSGFYAGPDRDPEGSYLLALAYAQADQHFSPLWRRLVLGEEMPDRPYRDIGLLGFRKMPDALGQPASDVPDGLLQSVIELAERPKVDPGEWQQIMRSIFAAYRRSEDYWIRRLRDVASDLSAHDGRAREWLAALLPHWDRPLAPGPGRSLRAVPLRECQEWVRRVAENPDLCESDELGQFLERHRAYARATGHAEYLGKTFNNLVKRVIEADPTKAPWAIELTEEAKDWEPHEPRRWVSYARVLWKGHREGEALDALWTARYRFPWDAFVRGELGRLLREAGDIATSKSVYREATAHFPDNVVCRNSLGYLLMDLGDIEEAERLFEEARGIAPRDQYARSGLAEVWFIKSARANDAALRDRARDMLGELAREGDQFAQGRLGDFDHRWQLAVERGGIRYEREPGEAAPSSPAPLPERTIEEMSAAERLGRAMIALWHAEGQAATQERIRFCDTALTLLGPPQKDMGQLLTGFVETRGLVLLAKGDAQAALDYFTDQIQRYGRGGWIGIRLGQQRAQLILGQSVTPLPDEPAFSSRSVKFAIHVFIVLRCLVANEDEQEIARRLRSLYPEAKQLADQWLSSAGPEQPASSAPADESVANSAMIASFVQARWFRPAGIVSEEDLADESGLRRVREEVLATEKDAFNLLANAALTLAA